MGCAFCASPKAVFKFEKNTPHINVQKCCHKFFDSELD
jgi:hypothetical protein